MIGKERLGKWYPYLSKKFTPARMNAIVEQQKEDLEEGFKSLPKKADRFAVFQNTDPETVKVVVMADGVLPGSLGYCLSSDKNNKYTEAIFQAIKDANESTGRRMDTQADRDLFQPDFHSWALRDIMPLNVSLTQPYDKKGRRGPTHLGLWSWLTEAVIETLVKQDRPVAFIMLDEAATEYIPAVQPSAKRVCLKTQDIHEAVASPDKWNHKFCFFGAEYFLKYHKTPLLGEHGFHCIPF